MIDVTDLGLNRVVAPASELPMQYELRCVPVVFCDLVGSTALSARHHPDRYRSIVVAYKETCRGVVEESYGGHICFIKGDGILALFGYPRGADNDTRQAVLAGLGVIAAVRTLSASLANEIGQSLATRVAVHRGLVSIEGSGQDVYGFAANVGARLLELARPNALVVSAEVLSLVGDSFETVRQRPQTVKGIDQPLASWTVVGRNH